MHAKEQHKKIASICSVTGSVYGCKWMFIPNKYGIIIGIHPSPYAESGSIVCIFFKTQLEAYSLSLLRLLLPAGEFGAWIVMVHQWRPTLVVISRLTLAAFLALNRIPSQSYLQCSHISRCNPSPKSCTLW